MRTPSLAWTTIALAALTACSPRTDGAERTIVASVYPLAYAAERIAGPGWSVIDLTPPGAEAHDVELSLDDRTAVAEADVVLFLGPIGFQPQLEAAVVDAAGTVVDVTAGLRGAAAIDPATDPHVWLDPSLFGDLLEAVTGALEPLDATSAARGAEVGRALEALDRRYAEGLDDCRYRTLLVSHEAYGYLAARYDLRQFGLAGVSPEGEPTPDRIETALALVRDGDAGAVFYEPDEESQRIAESVAGPAGVPVLPLSPLESRPAQGDYLTVMEENLESLREGLGCR